MIDVVFVAYRILTSCKGFLTFLLQSEAENVWTNNCYRLVIGLLLLHVYTQVIVTSGCSCTPTRQIDPMVMADRDFCCSSVLQHLSIGNN
jgi:hypothetical protein